jgi:hypothetical protein
MKSIGPYVLARSSSGDGAAAQPPSGAAWPLWATDRLTGIPVVLQPLAAALDTLPTLPGHPALLPPSDLLSLPGEGEFVVTELPLQAVPATDARLAARGALQALDALHRQGQVHGQVSAAHLWSVDGQVRLSGAGLPTAASPTDDLRDLAVALGALGGLPAGLETLRTAPETLSAGDALRRLSWGVSGSQATQPRDVSAPPLTGSVAPDPAEDTFIPTAVAPLAVIPLPASPAPLTAQVFDLGPAAADPVAQSALPEEPSGGSQPLASEASVAAGPATDEPGEVVLIATAAPAPAPAGGAAVPVAPSRSKRGAGAQARQRLRADAARTEQRTAALEAGPAAEAPLPPAVPQADPPPSGALTGAVPVAPASPTVTPQERRRRMRAAAEAEAQAKAAAPPLTPPTRPPSLGPEEERKETAPRRELRPMRLRWNEAAGAAAGGGWQRGARDAAPAPGQRRPAGDLRRWRWPVLVGALVVLVLGGLWVWGQGRAQPQGMAAAACCSVQFELSGAAPASGVRLTLAQAPAGAGLSPGAALGTVPGTVSLPSAGTYRVRVAADGFTPETVSVTVPAAAPVRIELGR